jgi:penicillin-binding protein 1A
LALGSGEVTPLELARGYAVFANGGYLVQPYLIEHIENHLGDIVYTQPAALRCDQCADLDDSIKMAPRIITRENAFIMSHMMRDVIQYGTATRAKVLKRDDISGKTGTTNDQYDTWFAGFHPSLVAVSWVGFDEPKSLGKGEYGGRTALPMWIDFMSVALADIPEQQQTTPNNIAHVRIDKGTGLRDCGNAQNTLFEIFRIANIPERCSVPEEDDETPF